uniref:BPL/LPL catalytic domain-containing protein n=1 Tax=Panagrolaimus sp. ES5 TaxID=591445 RepID=A0AC34FMP7_9BILA
MTEKISKRIRMGVSSFGKELKPVEINVARKRFASLIPSDIDEKEIENKFYSRRRSLSPLTLSIIESHAESTTLTNTSAIGAHSRLLAAENFVRRRSVTPTRRRFHSIPKRGIELSHVEEKFESKPPQKPPSILVYTGNNPELYKRIFNSIQCIIPENTYTIFHLSSKALINEPWIDENAMCVLLGDTNSLGDKAWTKLQAYFIHSGKIIFLCQNSLLASLNSESGAKKQANLLKSAFGNKKISISLGKEFENFLKKSMKILNKNKEVNETFHAKDLVGAMSYSVVIHKKQDQPLLLYMENSANNASALFSDATADELIATGGISLIKDAMKRLKIQVVESQTIPSITKGYFICDPDKLAWDMKGLAYDEEIGNIPKLFFSNISENLPPPSSSLLPIEVCKRNFGFPRSCCGFDVDEYYKCLNTKTLGKAMLYFPVCETTMNISKSLFNALPTFDGILVIAGIQTKGYGRSGNQWLSPKGCAMFTFNFNIPLLSNLGQSATFIQHILAVSIVDAVITILDIEDFALKIKWPNDIYWARMFKMGGILVNSSISGETLHCVIGAGINVCNDKPTVSLNDIIPEGCDKILTVEEIIAETMNKFEHYVNMFEKNGKQAFLRRYYDFWLHTREEIYVQNAATNIKEHVVIRGLDSYGFLEVRSKQNGKVFSVHDNGNTFDMMKGLIRPKNRQ